MAYGRGRGRKEYTGVTTGCFKTKIPGLLRGGFDGEYLDKLIDVCEEAKRQRTGVVLFFKRLEDPEGSKVARATLDVSKGGGNYKLKSRDEDDEPRSKRRDRDEEDEPRSKRRNEDEDERPRRSRDEEDEDERPAKKSKKKSDEDDW